MGKKLKQIHKIPQDQSSLTGNVPKNMSKWILQSWMILPVHIHLSIINFSNNIISMHMISNIF
jgi:hypothetical protein